MKLTLSTSELKKLTERQRKQYVMLTGILRDLLLLQKLLIFNTDEREGNEVLRSACAAQSLFLVSVLASKLHEAGAFLCKEELLTAVPGSLQETKDKVTAFYARPHVRILKFIRDKFAFHYDTRADLDPKIDAAFRELPQATMWLSKDDSGNDVFSSTNDVISEVLYREAQALGFLGDRPAFLKHLLGMVIDGARVVANFGRGYLACCFPVTWEEAGSEEVEAVLCDKVILPSVITRTG